MSHRPNTEKQAGKLGHWSWFTFGLLLFDFFSIYCSYTLALWLRFDFQFNKIYVDTWINHRTLIVPYALICLGLYAWFRMYRNVWKVAKFEDFKAAVKALILALLIVIAEAVFVFRMPVSYYVFGFAGQTVLALGIRFAYRAVVLFKSQEKAEQGKQRVLLIGAGDAGQRLLRALQEKKGKTGQQICCIIDDRSSLWGSYISDVFVFGGTEEIRRAVEQYEIEAIWLAIPSLPEENRRELLEICRSTYCEVFQLPAIYQHAPEEVAPQALQRVTIADVLESGADRALGRELFRFVRGKAVLVAGAGVLGRELCRQVALNTPQRLIVLDNSDRALSELRQELMEKHSFLNLETVLLPLGNEKELHRVLEDYRPDIVYHAAAYGCASIMEANLCESIRNNVTGTRNLMQAALDAGAERFVLAESAPGETLGSLPGKLERARESLLKEYARKGSTAFVAVRMGAVHDEEDPTVKAIALQIAAGGPVKLRSAESCRCYLTKKEAASLFIHCGGTGESGSIYALASGSCVNLTELTKEMIRRAGSRLGADIAVTYEESGLAGTENTPGTTDALQKTQNEKIFLCPDDGICEEKTLSELEAAAAAGDKAGAALLLRRISSAGEAEQKPRECG